MENTWDNFWKSGSVNDYLAYCKGAEYAQTKDKKEEPELMNTPVMGRMQTTFSPGLKS